MARLSFRPISLPAACGPHLDGLDRAPRVSDVTQWLRGVEGKRSLTFLDPADPAPGRAEIAALAERYGLRPDELIASVEEQLGDY